MVGERQGIVLLVNFVLFCYAVSSENVAINYVFRQRRLKTYAAASKYPATYEGCTVLLSISIYFPIFLTRGRLVVVGSTPPGGVQKV
jgi:hypothetical protein